ncbi:MAG: hypothetical protein ACD_62C00691G0008 [uncultured bacterium]|nr:MAG: hypothetical protein ACD_62C00691G0008 [uncultured bacterium]
MWDYFQNKTILITGASSGIGEDLALSSALPNWLFDLLIPRLSGQKKDLEPRLL